jgi:hypothetical protein
MNTILKFDKQIILCCKGYFDGVTDKSRYEQLKWIISKECEVDVNIYEKDLGFISFLFDIIESFNINYMRVIYTIWDDVKNKYEPYSSDNLLNH